MKFKLLDLFQNNKNLTPSPSSKEGEEFFCFFKTFKFPLSRGLGGTIVRSIFNFVFILLFLTSCSAQKQISHINISKNGQFNLASPTTFNKITELNQRLTAQYQEQKYSLNLFTKISPRLISVWGFTATGNRLFSLQYKNKELKAELSKFLIGNKNIKLEYMLADIELVYLDSKTITKNLSKNIIMKEFARDEGFERIFYIDEKPIIQILYSQKELYESKIYYQHLERQYIYTIENI